MVNVVGVGIFGGGAAPRPAPEAFAVLPVPEAGDILFLVVSISVSLASAALSIIGAIDQFVLLVMGTCIPGAFLLVGLNISLLPRQNLSSVCSVALPPFG